LGPCRDPQCCQMSRGCRVRRPTNELRWVWSSAVHVDGAEGWGWTHVGGVYRSLMKRRARSQFVVDRRQYARCVHDCDSSWPLWAQNSLLIDHVLRICRVRRTVRLRSKRLASRLATAVDVKQQWYGACPKNETPRFFLFYSAHWPSATVQ